MVITKDLGAVSAYAYAVEQGYQGTEEEFAELMARQATVAEEAAASADAAAASERNAQASEQNAAASATAASGSATAASTKASEAASSASAAASSASTASGKASEASASATAAAQSASSSASAASQAASSASSAESSATDAEQAKTDAQTAQSAAETAQGKAEDAQAAAEAAAQSVSASAAQIAKNTDNFASAFSASTTYAIGDYCIYDGNLYRFINAHTGAWSASDVEATNVGGEIGDVKSAIYDMHNAGFSPLKKNYQWVSGSYDSTTGEPVALVMRERINNYIDSFVTRIIAMSGHGVLLYAWNNNGDYIGFWGGSGWVTSGSEYLMDIDMSQFRTTYPQYKFKAVVYQNESQYIDFQCGNSVLFDLGQIIPMHYSWRNGYLSNSNTTPTVVNSASRICTGEYISKDVKSIIAQTGYKFRVMAFSADGVSAGNYRTTGKFELVGTSADLDYFDFTKCNYYGYKLTVLKADNSTISPEDAGNSIFQIPFAVDNEKATPFKNINKNMCLAGIKTDILTEKIPYHRGYLFHKLQNNDNSLWYGESFDKIENIGLVSFNPTLMRFAISPKDGRIIAVQRDIRNGIWVWDGTTETHLDSFTSNPQAWLYNSGVDFINYNDDEYCIFAEYSGTIVSGYALNVWRGKYPYTSASDWEIVLTQYQETDITHFHMVRRDPWTNILYLTAGDSSSESKWWYSTDGGANWTLLVSGAETGWGNSLCRTINFIFTKDYIYWATDHGELGGQHHTLNRIQRDAETGVIDLTTKEQITLLPQLYATNSLCYVESPNGLFMYDRIDVNSSSVFDEPIKMLFWDFATEELVEIASLKLTESTWGGSRGKCYINYTNGKAVMPAMGFSIDTPCIFDLVCDNPANIGTIAYDVGSKTVHTINY